MRALTIAILLSACNPAAFDDLRNQAPTVTLVAGEGYPVSTFGAVVTGWEGTLAGERLTRVAVSAGPDSPFRVFPISRAAALELGPAVYDGCDDEFPCGAGAGASLVGLSGWGARRACVAIAATGTGEVFIRCEDDVSLFERVAGPPGQDFGASGVGLGDHVVGRAIYGAPGAGGGAGALYRLPDGSGPVVLDLTGATGGELGRSVAAAPVDADTILLAAGAPALDRVVVATVDGGASVVTTVAACPSGAPGYGRAIAVGDLDGDARPEVAIATAAGEIEIYAGASLPAGGCGAAWSPAVVITCADDARLACNGSGFGAALAIGDVDGDGLGDLIAGAPQATVGGASEAGALVIMAGASSLANLGMRRASAAHSSPTPGARIGEALATVPGDARAEIVAGAPGVSRAYVFFCSGLDGDSPSTTPEARCQPR